MKKRLIKETDFRDIVKENVKRVLFEKTLNRVEQYVRDYEIAIITAWRNQFINATDKTDRPTHIKTEKGQRGKKIDTQIPFDDGEQYTTVEKKYYNKQLQATLLNYGYGVTKVRGRWHEELSNPNSDDEESFFVVNLPRKDGTVDKNFKQHIFELSEKTGQDAFTYSPKGSTKGYAIGTNNASWPGYGKSVELGNFTKNITAQAMTLVGNNGFSFLNTDTEYTNSQPNSFLQRKQQRKNNSPVGVLETMESYNVIARRLITEEAREFLSTIIYTKNAETRDLRNSHV